MVAHRYNVSTLLDANVEAERGDKVAVIAGDEQVTYGELLSRVEAMASAYRALGVVREQRVLLVLDDTAAFPVAFFGAIRTGAVPVPVNPYSVPTDFPYFIADSYARVVVTDSSRAETLRPALAGPDGAARLITVDQGVDGALLLGDLLAEHAGAGLPPADTHRDDMAFWLYSSGSTGRPKGVVHLHRAIPYTCQAYADQVLGIVADDVTFSSTKLFHAYGMGNNLTFPYWAGATTVLMEGKPTPGSVLDTIERHHPSLFFSAPTLYNAILKTPGAADRDLSSVRRCVSAAESLPAEVFRRWRDTFGVTILDGIGSTEMLHIYCSNAQGDLRPGSSGKAVPGYELELRDLDGALTPPGEVGNLLVRGGSALAAYWHQQEKTRHSVRGEWFFTGDRYRLDADGFYWYEGRTDDMMKVSGLWVSPVEIEGTLLEHPGVYEAAVVGVDVEGLNRIKAFVIRTPDHAGEDLADELAQWCKSRLARHKFPHLVEFVDDLPKTTTGKIQRFKLRAPA